MQELAGTRIAVLGLGASGDAAARLALQQGGRVHVSDSSTSPAAAARADRLRAFGAEVLLGGHDLDAASGADLRVASPGIPPDAPVLRELRARGAGWISEFDFALRFLRAPLIVVTGTNGKTTTSAWIAHLLAAGGERVGLGGNIGAGLGPAASGLALDPEPFDRIVLEASSFQLADTRSLRPQVGVVTNLAADHLDRYPTVAAYHADKARLFLNAEPSSRWVLNDSLREVVPPFPAPNVPGLRARFGTEIPLPSTGWGAAEADGVLTLVKEGERIPLIATEELPLLGRHNVENALAALLAAALAGIDPEALRTGLRTFRPIAHRLEPVGSAGGVLWVNDSKATNMAAARSAILSLEREGPIVLLLGGAEKGEEVDLLREVLPGRVRTVVCYGVSGPRLAAALAGTVPVEEVRTGFDDAVEHGAAAARDGEILLLAPATSSFDLFANYEERGERFRALAKAHGAAERSVTAGGSTAWGGTA